MAYFKICVRNQRADGMYPIYVRITHHRKIGYIKTDKICKSKFVKNGEIVDPFIIKDIYIIINNYIDRLNKINIEDWAVKDIVDFLKNPVDIGSFSDFIKEYIQDGISKNKTGIKNYSTAHECLKRFLNKDDIHYSDLSPEMMSRWIYSLRDTRKAKNAYPTNIRTMFNLACEKYNNYEDNVVPIKCNPFKGVKIPHPDVSLRRAVPIENIRIFFNSEIEEKRFINTKNQMSLETARDICYMVFCLVGINAIDLYKMEKSNYIGGKLCYNRSKTKNRRSDKAYIEITVPECVKPLFAKYAGRDKLFYFAEKYWNSSVFTCTIDMHVKTICKQLSIDPVTPYNFRHSWATIAANDLGVDIGTVAFCLNHVSAHPTTWGYINTDFSKIDRINEKVLELVFGKKEDKSL